MKLQARVLSMKHHGIRTGAPIRVALTSAAVLADLWLRYRCRTDQPRLNRQAPGDEEVKG
jgi:hypothetical protein